MRQVWRNTSTWVLGLAGVCGAAVGIRLGAVGYVLDRVPPDGIAASAIDQCEPLDLGTLRKVVVQRLTPPCGPGWLTRPVLGGITGTTRRWLQSEAKRADAVFDHARLSTLLIAAGEPVPLPMLDALRALPSGDPIRRHALDLMSHRATSPTWLDPQLASEVRLHRWERTGETPPDAPHLLRRDAWGWQRFDAPLGSIVERTLRMRVSAAVLDDDEFAPPNRYRGPVRPDAPMRLAVLCTVPEGAACTLGVADWLARPPGDGDNAPGNPSHRGPTALAGWWDLVWGDAAHTDTAEAWLREHGNWLRKLPGPERSDALRAIVTGEDRGTTGGAGPIAVLRDRTGTAWSLAATAGALAMAAQLPFELGDVDGLPWIRFGRDDTWTSVCPGAPRTPHAPPIKVRFADALAAMSEDMADERTQDGDPRGAGRLRGFAARLQGRSHEATGLAEAVGVAIVAPVLDRSGELKHRRERCTFLPNERTISLLP